MIAVVNTGGANLASVTAAFARLGAEAELTSDPATIRRADKLVLPGVGAAADSMERLRRAGLVEVLRTVSQPMLAICLGMQLLFEHSDEGDTPCLGLLAGRVRRFPVVPSLTVPHMGWNALQIKQDDPLLASLPEPPYVYFVHSYIAPDGPWVLATSEHGGTFPAVCRRGNVWGVQFHPERSSSVGAQLLQNFMAL